MQILKLEWLKFRRSSMLNRGILKLVLLGFLFLYFAISFIGLGVGILFINENELDNQPTISSLNQIGKFILYYFVLDIVLRFVLQKFPSLDLRKYLLTPIKKSTISHFALIRSLLNYFNIFPFLFTISLATTVSLAISPTYGLKVALLLSGFILINNYISFSLTSRFEAQVKTIFAIVAALVLLLFLDVKNYIQISPILDSIWKFLINSGWAYLLPLLATPFLYYFDFRYLSNNLYTEAIKSPDQATHSNFLNFKKLNNYGSIGQLINLEIKLILRNQRSRSLLWISLFMLTYPLIFSGEEYSGFLIFVSIVVTGMFAMNYGQLMFSWNGSYFDLLLTRNVVLKDIFLAKYYLLSLSCITLTIPTLLYGFRDSIYFLYLPTMCIYNIGVSIYLYMILGCFKSKRIDVQKKATMNYEGISALHFLIMIPVIGIPYLIIFLSKLTSVDHLGLIILTLSGLIGIIFHHQIINWILSIFIKKKYAIAHTFRTEAQ